MPKLIVFLGKKIVWDSSREKRAIKIGKLDDNDIVLRDSRVSRHHAAIVKEGLKFYVYDNGSTNGTYLNNKRLPQKIRRELSEEGKIFISPYILSCKILPDIDLHQGTRVEPMDDVVEDSFHYGSMLGKSDVMLKVYEQIQKVAKECEPVLIRGESGTGKELVAWEIFTSGNRVDKPYVAINSGAIPKTLLLSELFGHEKGAFSGADARKGGKFEEADGGTLFLDEIGDTLPETQVALLRVLQDGMFYRIGGREEIRVDVRVVSATNQNLEQSIENGKFREDLYQRLGVYTILLPPLRERGEDIDLLAQHFLKHYGMEKSGYISVLTPKALERLRNFPWPGNVRQLDSVIKRTLLYKADASPIDVDDIDLDEIRQPFGDSVLKNPTRPQFIKILEEVNWNTRRAAELLGVTPKAVQNKANRYGLKLREIKKHGYSPE
ncbi:MAG: FHA domain-containing protein [bacterium]|nr:FHA domain-containing protein [bacterium]